MCRVSGFRCGPRVVYPLVRMMSGSPHTPWEAVEAANVRVQEMASAVP